MPRILAVTGGVGGAKLASGLASVLDPSDLAFAVNTGDDFEHLGLKISPDIDSLTYALAGINNTETGWGRKGESWNFLTALKELGGDTWFQLGDKDLALHLHRTNMLNEGKTLTEATEAIATKLGIRHPIIPMSDQPVSTLVNTSDGELSFQSYFVKEKCEPEVNGFRFQGIEHASLQEKLDQWIQECRGIIICPSNPYVSVDPFLKLNGVKERLAEIPTIAVSPIIGGKALKGPAAKMMKELGISSSAENVAEHYSAFIDGFVIDEADKESAKSIKIPTISTNTVMLTLSDSISLAENCLGFLERFL
mgnify:FL=1